MLTINFEPMTFLDYLRLWFEVFVSITPQIAIGALFWMLVKYCKKCRSKYQVGEKFYGRDITGLLGIDDKEKSKKYQRANVVCKVMDSLFFVYVAYIILYLPVKFYELFYM